MSRYYYDWAVSSVSSLVAPYSRPCDTTKLHLAIHYLCVVLDLLTHTFFSTLLFLRAYKLLNTISIFAWINFLRERNVPAYKSFPSCQFFINIVFALQMHVYIFLSYIKKKKFIWRKRKLSYFIHAAIIHFKLKLIFTYIVPYSLYTLRSA